MVPMHEQKRKGAFHAPTPLPAFGHPLPAWRGEGRERGANLVHGPNACEKRKGAFHEPPLTPSLSPSEGGEGARRAGEGDGSWSQCVRKSERRLPMNPEQHRTPN